EEVASSRPSRGPGVAVAETTARTLETSSAPGVLRTSPGALAETSARSSETDASPTPGSSSASEVPSDPQRGVGEDHGRGQPHPLPPRPTPALIEPLSPARYRVQLTAPQAFMDKFDRARALLAHSCPQGDLAIIL